MPVEYVHKWKVGDQEYTSRAEVAQQIKYVKQWQVGDQVFDKRADAVRHEAKLALAAHGVSDVDNVIASAETVIGLLRVFMPKRTRGPRQPRAVSVQVPRKGKRTAA